MSGDEIQGFGVSDEPYEDEPKLPIDLDDDTDGDNDQHADGTARY